MCPAFIFKALGSMPRRGREAIQVRSLAGLDLRRGYEAPFLVKPSTRQIKEGIQYRKLHAF